MVTHTWLERGKHACGYIWTNPDSRSVVCACGGAWLLDGVPTNLDEVTDETEFKQVVSDDLGIPLVELDLQQGVA